ncbi:hypothetical protein OAG71_04275, partial [bacterium]|nr:hypothetical protein [bacterium]
WIDTEPTASFHLNQTKAQSLTAKQALERFNGDANSGFLNPQWAQTIDWKDIPDFDAWIKSEPQLAELVQKDRRSMPSARVVRMSKRQVEVKVTRAVGLYNGRSYYGVAKHFRIPRSIEVDQALGLAEIEAPHLTTYRGIGKFTTKADVEKQLGKPDHIRGLQNGDSYNYYFDENVTLFFQNDQVHTVTLNVPSDVIEQVKRDANFTWSGEGDSKQLTIYEATDEMLATIAERQDIVELRLYADRIGGYNGPANQKPPSGVTNDGLRHLAGLTNLRVLNLPERGITDAGLVHLKNLDNLQELLLDFLPLTDECTTHLRDLTGLKVLHFYQASITDKGMQNFRDMLELEDLQLGESLITDRSMSLIGNMKKLKTLDLRTKITDEGTVHLAGLSELTWLALNATAVTDRSLEHIGKLAKLEWLVLENTVVGDAGIEHLRNHKNITTLYLSSTSVTDQCLDTLATIKTLEHLKLNDTQITDEGLRDRIWLKPAPRSWSGTDRRLAGSLLPRPELILAPRPMTIAWTTR